MVFRTERKPTIRLGGAVMDGLDETVDPPSRAGWLNCERFAKGLRIYGIDQDEQQEYAGRFLRYLGGSYVQICTLAEAEAFRFDDVVNPEVVIWDLLDSAEQDRGAIFAQLKAHLVAHLLAHPGRAAFIVDEAVTVTEDDLGASTLGDLVRGGRHFGLEVHVLTRRVTDWFDSRIGRTIQSVAASKWFGQMEAPELYEIAPSLGISPRNATASRRLARVRACW